MIKNIIIPNFIYNLMLIVLAIVILTTTGCDSSGGNGDDFFPIRNGDDSSNETDDGSQTTFSISGSIYTSSNTAVDSDVNDPLATYISNDTFADAQDIINPVTLGGYVNVAGYGEAGRSFDSGDQIDCFKVTLSAGQTISLYISDYNPGNSAECDLDLYLYPALNPDINNPINYSAGVSDSESLTIAASGDYIILVHAYYDSKTDYGSASNYTLTIGQISTANSYRTLRLSSEFIPDEVIVRFKNKILPANTNNSPASLASSLGMRHKAGDMNRPMLLTFKDKIQKAEAFQILGISDSKHGINGLRSNNPEIKRKAETLQVIKSLCKRSDILYAEPNYIRKPFMTPNDEYYPLQTHYPLINLPQAWDITQGSGVIVAVIDTGVIMSHADLASNIGNDGYDFISDSTNAMDGDGIDPDPDDPGDNTQGGSSFHGTHVAGTVAAVTNNSTGVAGVAGSSQIMPLRVLGQSGGTVYDIAQAIYYAAQLSNDSNVLPLEKADIINMSLGGGGYSQTMYDACAAARNKDVIIIAAAGNDSSSQLSYPASYDGVISVSAVGMDSKLAPYSNFGTKIDVTAPGGDLSEDLNGDGYSDGVLSTCGDDSSGSIKQNYRFYQGTSMASPHMAGVAALMKSLNPLLTPDGLDSLLESGLITTDIGASGRDDYYGYGLIDAYKAVIASQSGSVPTVIKVTPEFLDFGNISTSATIILEKQGTDPLSVNQISDNAGWLTVTPINTDADGFGNYTVSIDRTNLAIGNYKAEITITGSDYSTKTISVTMRMEDPNTFGNAGLHYILLVNKDTLDTIAQVEANASQGVYNYTFTNIASGEYLIFAGTDLDNDFIIGDAGEALGAYMSLDQPSLINVSQDISGLNFNTGFNVNLPASQALLNEDIITEKRPVIRRLKQPKQIMR